MTVNFGVDCKIQKLSVDQKYTLNEKKIYQIETLLIK